MNVALWIICCVCWRRLHGRRPGQADRPKAKLAAAPGGEWVDDFSPGAVKGLGGLDLLGAVGLIAARGPGIAPVLVPLAGVGPVLLMVGAVLMRLRHGGARAIGWT